MKLLATIAVLALSASPASAQANANLAPGAVVDGSKATVNAAEGTAPDGKPAPGGRGDEGKQAETSGSKMVKQGNSGAQPPTKAETSDKP